MTKDEIKNNNLGFDFNNFLIYIFSFVLLFVVICMLASIIELNKQNRLKLNLLEAQLTGPIFDTNTQLASKNIEHKKRNYLPNTLIGDDTSKRNDQKFWISHILQLYNVNVSTALNLYKNEVTKICVDLENNKCKTLMRSILTNYFGDNILYNKLVNNINVENTKLNDMILILQDMDIINTMNINDILGFIDEKLYTNPFFFFHILDDYFYHIYTTNNEIIDHNKDQIPITCKIFNSRLEFTLINTSSIKIGDENMYINIKNINFLEFSNCFDDFDYSFNIMLNQQFIEHLKSNTLKNIDNQIYNNNFIILHNNNALHNKKKFKTIKLKPLTKGPFYSSTSVNMQTNIAINNRKFKLLLQFKETTQKENKHVELILPQIMYYQI